MNTPLQRITHDRLPPDPAPGEGAAVHCYIDPADVQLFLVLGWRLVDADGPTMAPPQTEGQQ